jgi:hypothetical protein
MKIPLIPLIFLTRQGAKKSGIRYRANQSCCSRMSLPPRSRLFFVLSHRNTTTTPRMKFAAATSIGLLSLAAASAQTPEEKPFKCYVGTVVVDANNRAILTQGVQIKEVPGGQWCQLITYPCTHTSVTKTCADNAGAQKVLVYRYAPHAPSMTTLPVRCQRPFLALPTKRHLRRPMRPFRLIALTANWAWTPKSTPFECGVDDALVLAV